MARPRAGSQPPKVPRRPRCSRPGLGSTPCACAAAGAEVGVGFLEPPGALGRPLRPPVLPTAPTPLQSAPSAKGCRGETQPYVCGCSLSALQAGTSAVAPWGRIGILGDPSVPVVAAFPWGPHASPHPCHKKRRVLWPAGAELPQLCALRREALAVTARVCAGASAGAAPSYSGGPRECGGGAEPAS